MNCLSISCHGVAAPGSDFCPQCQERQHNPTSPVSARRPWDFRALGDESSLDAFAVNRLFGINDPSGCTQHALQLLLKTPNSANCRAFIQEARDTLDRWLELNPTQGNQA